VVFIKNIKVTAFDNRTLSTTSHTYIEQEPSSLGDLYKKVRCHLELNPSESHVELSQSLSQTAILNRISDIIAATGNGAKEFIVKATIESYDNQPYEACKNPKCPSIKINVDENNNKKCKTCHGEETRQCPVLNVCNLSKFFFSLIKTRENACQVVLKKTPITRQTWHKYLQNCIASIQTYLNLIFFKR
jgi:hypothetical protein